MKRLLILVTLLVTLNSYSQSIGDPVADLIADTTLQFYGFQDNYGEFIRSYDTCILVYIVAYKHNIVVGIDYLYPDRESALEGLKICFNGVLEIGNEIYLKDNLLIVLKNGEILTRDVRYFKREYTNAYSSQ